MPSDIIACHRLAHQLTSEDFTFPGAEKHYPPDLQLEPVHIEIRLSVDVDGRSASGSVTHTVRARRDGPRTLTLDGVDLDLIQVRSVATSSRVGDSPPSGDTDSTDAESEGTAGSLDWSYDGKHIRITWDAPFDAGEERRVRIDYAVVEPTGGLYFRGPTDYEPDAAAYAATDHETERARHWLPCIDHPSVRPTLDIHLTADARFTILANGELVSENEEGGDKTAHWRQAYPCPSYLTCFVIGELIRVDDETFDNPVANGGPPSGATTDGSPTNDLSAGATSSATSTGHSAGPSASGPSDRARLPAPPERVPVAYFTTPDHTDDQLSRSFGRTPKMLDWLTSKLDQPFPFAKYYQFALPGFTGAMENISLVSWNDLYVLNEPLAGEWGHLVDAVNIHEMAHSYFGDAIVTRDFAHAWLKESWATYIERVWWEDTEGQDEALYDYYNNAQNYFEEADSSYKRPIVTRTFNSSWDMFDRHLYPGGACRLHTLRHRLGDDAFWAGVRRWVAESMGQVVETEDFRRPLEAVSGHSLVEFFEHWFYSPGYPSLKVSFRYDAERNEGRFELEQTQVDDDAGIPAFSFDLDLGWVIDGELHTQTVEVESAKHMFLVPMSEDPGQVRVDPGAKVLHKLEFDPGKEKLRKQLTSAADVIGRIQAATTLAKTPSRSNIDAIADAYADENHWGVRVEMAKAVAGIRSDHAVGVLAQLIRDETSPRVIGRVIMAAKGIRDRRILAAIEERIDSGLPPFALRTAYEALGTQRELAPMDRLTEAARIEGYGGLAQSGALTGLALSRQEGAIDALLDAVAPGGVPERSRPAAASGLGSVGSVQVRRQRERIAEALTDRLRDPNRHVRHAAVAGLRSLADMGTIAALDAYARPVPKQEQVFVQRVIRSIRSSQESKTEATDKQLDELQKDIRKLRDALQELEAKVDGAND